jgi:hypothetical protein
LRNVTEEWRKLNNEELHKLYCSPNKARAIKININKRIRTQFYAETVKCRDHLENLVAEGKIILK